MPEWICKIEAIDVKVTYDTIRYNPTEEVTDTEEEAIDWATDHFVKSLKWSITRDGMPFGQWDIKCRQIDPDTEPYDSY